MIRPSLAIAVCLSASTSWCGPAHGADAPLTTNVDLVVQTAAAAIEDGLAGLDARSDSISWRPPLLIAPREKHDANWIVEHLLIEQVLSRGIAVVLDTAAVDSTATRLSYRIVDLSMGGWSGLMGTSVTRECRIEIALRLSQEGDGAVLWQSSAPARRSDRVPKARLDALANDEYAFADTQIEKRSWGKVAEPAIVSGVLGMLVYFFFSNR